MSLEIEVKGTSKETSEWQNRINALAKLGDLEAHGIKTHILMENIDTTKDDELAHEVEEAISKSPADQLTKNIIFERARRISNRRRNQRIISKLH